MTRFGIYDTGTASSRKLLKNRCEHGEGESITSCLRACAQETRVAQRRGCARCDAMCDEPAGDVQEL